MDEVQFRIDGEMAKKANLEEIESPVTVVAEAYDTDGIVEVFSDHERFNKWASGTRYADEVERVQSGIEAAREHEREDHTEEIERHKETAERIRADLEKLAAQTGLECPSEELLRRATVERPDDEPAIFDSAVLWEHPGFGGRWIPLVVILHDFRWVGFNDVASSLWRHGGGHPTVLYTETYLRGRELWLWSPWVMLSDLGVLGFNDVASSSFG